MNNQERKSFVQMAEIFALSLRRADCNRSAWQMALKDAEQAAQRSGDQELARKISKIVTKTFKEMKKQ